MVADIFSQLTEEEAEFLALVYEESRSFSTFMKLADMLMKRDCIQNCVSDLTLFGENLARTKRNDLQMKVEDYIQRNKPPQDVPERLFSLQPVQISQTRVTVTNHSAMDAIHPIQTSQARVTSTRVAMDTIHPIQTSQARVTSTRVAMNAIHPIQERVTSTRVAMDGVHPIHISQATVTSTKDLSVDAESYDSDTSTASALVYHKSRG